jgi:ferredoxin
MPWVDEGECIGCGVCVEICPSGAISLKDDKAKIEMAICIRCGRCHSACPENAVMHDSKKIPEEVRQNVQKTREFMELCAENFGNSEKEKKNCLGRMIKHFKKEKLVAEKTLEELENLMEKEG